MTPTLDNTIIHVPHASTVIPAKHRKSLLIDDVTLDNELLRLTDWHTDQLFNLSNRGARMILFPVSRIICDPERFIDDDKEPASRVGMGCVYTSTSLGETLRDTNSTMWPQNRQAVISQYYNTHHKNLHMVTEDVLSRFNSVIFIDAHSFPNKPLPTETNPGTHRPDICIGTDSFHTPEHLRDCAVSAFRNKGLSVAVNSPFEGVLVPSQFAQNDSRIHAIMIEVNRDVYLEQGKYKRTNFDAIKEIICHVIEQLAYTAMGTGQ